MTFSNQKAADAFRDEANRYILREAATANQGAMLSFGERRGLPLVKIVKARLRLRRKTAKTA